MIGTISRLENDDSEACDSVLQILVTNILQKQEEENQQIT